MRKKQKVLRFYRSITRLFPNRKDRDFIRRLIEEAKNA